MSSNKLALNMFFASHIMYHITNYTTSVLNGAYIDAMATMIELINQFPPQLKEHDAIKAFYDEAIGVDDRAEKDASGSTRNMRTFNKSNLKSQYCEEIIKSHGSLLFDAFHGVGLFQLETDMALFTDLSGGKRSN